MNRFWTFVVGGALFGWGLYETEHTLSLKFSGARAPGNVVAAKVSKDGRYPWSSNSFAPVVEYKTPDGKQHGFISTISSGFFDYKLGEKVTVVYDADRPDDDARIDSFMVNWFTPLFGLGLGGWALLWFFGIVKTKDGESPFRSDRRRWWEDD
jgi:hypothetical protein